MGEVPIVERRATLFDAIAHGDDEHRAWLREAIDAHFAGQPVPPVRGRGRKEALITAAADALRLAIPIIEEERESMVSSYTVLYRGSPDFGKVVDADAVEWITAADAALDAARAVLAKVQS